MEKPVNINTSLEFGKNYYPVSFFDLSCPSCSNRIRAIPREESFVPDRSSARY